MQQRDLTGWFYGYVEGLPGTTTTVRTKAWLKRDGVVSHIQGLIRRHPSARCLSVHRVAASAPADDDPEVEVTFN